MYTFADPLEHGRRVAATREAIVCGDTRLTFSGLYTRCRKLAGALAAADVGVGERIAILADNSSQYIELYAGAPACGRVIVPLNTRHAEPELVYTLSDSGARVLLTDRDPGRLADCVEHVVRMPDPYEAWIGGADEAPLSVGVDENTLAGLFYTGGTTGAAKGVMLSHRNLIANAFHWMAHVPSQSDDRMLVMAPLFHAAGSAGVITCLWSTATQIVLPAFAPTAALDLIEAERCTSTLGVPTMLSALAEEQLRHPREIGSLRWIAHGGSPIASEVLRRVHRAFPSAELIEVYGATELSPLATVKRHEEASIDHARARSCGQPLPGVTLRIVDADGCELATGEVGEVSVRAPTVMQGYWNKPEQTASVLRDGWYRTGDLGYMDDESFLYLVDRSKDMIVSGGENVYSIEVEEILYKHPAVLEAAVFAVPDEKWGEAVWAAVHPRAGESVDAAALIAFCRQYIGGYKVPKGIDVHDEPLPKSGPGKFLKRQLREPYWKDQERAVH